MREAGQDAIRATLWDQLAESSAEPLQHCHAF
jgi:hypothetical protein